MSDWIHCNKCATRFGKNIKFFLSECGHITCQKCVEKINESKKCIICNKATTVMQLGKDMEPRISQYFMPLETSHQKTLEIYNFQLQHRNMLFQTLLNKYNYVKKGFINTNNIVTRLIKENHMLCNMLRSAGQNPQNFSTSTPVSQTPDTFKNASMVSSIPTLANMSGCFTPRAYPGYPRRMNIFETGSLKGPSPMFSHGRRMMEPSVHQHAGPTMSHPMPHLRRE